MVVRDTNHPEESEDTMATSTGKKLALLACAVLAALALGACSSQAASSSAATESSASASAAVESSQSAGASSAAQQPKEGAGPNNQGDKIEAQANEGELLLFVNCANSNVEKKTIPSTADDGTQLSAENFMDYYDLYTYEYDGKTWMLNEALYDFDDKGRVFLNYTTYEESSPQVKTVQVYANIDYAQQDVKGSFSEGSVDIECNADGTFNVASFMEKYAEEYGNAGSITLENGKALPLTDLNIQFAEGRVYMIYGKGLSLEDTQ